MQALLAQLGGGAVSQADIDAMLAACENNELHTLSAGQQATVVRLLALVTETQSRTQQRDVDMQERSVDFSESVDVSMYDPSDEEEAGRDGAVEHAVDSRRYRESRQNIYSEYTVDANAHGGDAQAWGDVDVTMDDAGLPSARGDSRPPSRSRERSQSSRRMRVTQSHSDMSSHNHGRSRAPSQHAANSRRPQKSDVVSQHLKYRSSWGQTLPSYMGALKR
jgi:hypothetical protein